MMRIMFVYRRTDGVVLLVFGSCVPALIEIDLIADERLTCSKSIVG